MMKQQKNYQIQFSDFNNLLGNLEGEILFTIIFFNSDNLQIGHRGQRTHARVKIKNKI